MNNNPYFISLGVGFVVFIAIVLLKRSKSEEVNRADVIKIALVAAGLTFAALNVYERPQTPVLAEPFIASCEA